MASITSYTVTVITLEMTFTVTIVDRKYIPRTREEGRSLQSPRYTLQVSQCLCPLDEFLQHFLINILQTYKSILQNG